MKHIYGLRTASYIGFTLFQHAISTWNLERLVVSVGPLANRHHCNSDTAEPVQAPTQEYDK